MRAANTLKTRNGENLAATSLTLRANYLLIQDEALLGTTTLTRRMKILPMRRKLRAAALEMRRHPHGCGTGWSWSGQASP
mmetsp:Transcript_17331/g.43569  ORF Transcript_17331/g.43569 Transcript_17331/m.43569 type:complete len:80 (-) Transcript_17331:1939-2178(-)